MRHCLKYSLPIQLLVPTTIACMKTDFLCCTIFSLNIALEATIPVGPKQSQEWVQTQKQTSKKCLHGRPKKCWIPLKLANKKKLVQLASSNCFTRCVVILSWMSIWSRIGWTCRHNIGRSILIPVLLNGIREMKEVQCVPNNQFQWHYQHQCDACLQKQDQCSIHGCDACEAAVLRSYVRPTVALSSSRSKFKKNACEANVRARHLK